MDIVAWGAYDDPVCLWRDKYDAVWDLLDSNDWLGVPDDDDLRPKCVTVYGYAVSNDCLEPACAEQVFLKEWFDSEHDPERTEGPYITTWDEKDWCATFRNGHMI